MNPRLTDIFVGDVADFSSRGPVQGFGQIKPDISAPGVNILAAAPTASFVWALANSGPMYATISGTSMATPHTAGSVALIREAHPDWTPDMIRTAMINTATNMRDQNQGPKADGLGADSIIAQGGGLIDVFHAANAKALMGATEDDGKGAFILGSHSYGEVPVVNNRVTSTQAVTVTIQDLSVQGGTYNLGVANNRDLQLSGINVTTSAPSVSVPAGGSTTFTVNATFDGNLIRDPNVADAVVSGNTVTFVPRPIEMQWYVTAQRADGAESLRMPFYFKPVFSVPKALSTDATTFTGAVAAGDGDLETVSGVTFVDIPFQVSDTTLKINAHLDFFQVVNGEVADLDLFLLDPDGNRIASSTNPGGPEDISVSVNRGGTYTYRVDGSLAANTNFTLTSTLSKAPSGPTLQTIPGDFVNAQGQHVDFDGSFNVNWTPNGGEQGFEIEESTDNQNWQILSDVSGATTSFALANQANGTYFFRVRAIDAGQIGMFVTNPGNVVSVLVDQRSKVDITNQVSEPISKVSLSGGVFQLDLALTNNSAQTYVPLVDLNVVNVSSATGTVKVINADNSKDGKTQANAALFGYSQKLGSDEMFSPSEMSGARTMRFQDSASEMFTFDAVVTGYLQTGAAASGSSSSSSAPASQQSSPSNDPLAGVLTKFTAVLRFTANPLTNTVTAQLVSLK